jgi:hypothetical protein
MATIVAACLRSLANGFACAVLWQLSYGLTMRCEPPPRFAVGRFGEFASDCCSRPDVSGGGR